MNNKSTTTKLLVIVLLAISVQFCCIGNASTDPTVINQITEILKKPVPDGSSLRYETLYKHIFSNLTPQQSADVHSEIMSKTSFGRYFYERLSTSTVDQRIIPLLEKKAGTLIVARKVTPKVKPAVSAIKPAALKIDVYHHVPFIPQPTSVSCWSTSLAMLLWYCDNEKSQSSNLVAISPEEVATNIKYYNQFFGTGGSGGLPVFDNKPFEFYGLTKINTDLTSNPVQYFEDIINKGPIWVGYEGCANPALNCGHAVVWVGLRGDGTHDGTNVILHDPDDGTGKYPNLGVRDREMTLTEFENRLSHRVIDRTSTGKDHTKLNYMAYKNCK